MSFSFEDAAPTTGKFEPNPFTEVVASIALKVNPETGAPVAKKFTTTADDKSIGKMIRQIRAAAHQANCTAKADWSDRDEASKAVTITFWTIPQQTRPRKPETKPTDVPPVKVVPAKATAPSKATPGNNK